LEYESTQIESLKKLRAIIRKASFFDHVRLRIEFGRIDDAAGTGGAVLKAVSYSP
jgi:hypothetical protein